MIAFKGGQLSANGQRTGLGGRFHPLIRYLVEGRREEDKPTDPHRLLHFAPYRLPARSPEAAAYLLSVCAEHARPDEERPVYHIGASAAPGEELTPEQWEQVAVWMLEELGLDEHEGAFFVHDDRGHQHIHIVMTRVSPKGKLFHPWMDYPKMRRAMRKAERVLGLQAVAEPVGVEATVDGVDRPVDTLADGVGRPVDTPVDGVDREDDGFGARRGPDKGLEVDGVDTLVDSVGTPADGVDQAVAGRRSRASSTASSTERPNQPRLSDGAYREARRTQQQPLADAIRMRALDDFLVADAWHDLESRLARHGLRLEPGKRGGGVVVWTDQDERVSVSRIDRRLSGPKLAKRFGETFREYRERVPERPVADHVVPVRRRLEIGTPAERADDLIRQLETERATFTEQEVRRHVKWQHDQAEVVAAVLGDRRVQRVGLDDGQRPLFTTAAYRQAELDLFDAADALRSRSTAQLDDYTVRRLVAEKYAFLSEEQRDAVLHATCRHDLALVAGRAGSGKTALATAVVESYQAEGYRVQGAALGGKAAEGLGAATGIDSRTLASLRLSWAKGKNQLDEKSVLLVDEAGMLGTRELAELLAIVEDRGAKVILVGDPEQIQAIEAGEAFAGLLERYRGARVDTIRRQRVDWMREASNELAEGHVAEALTAYDEHDLVRWAGDLNAAKWNLVASYFDDAERDPEATRLVFARRNADVDEINDHIRSRRKERGELGTEIRLKGRELAEGDRVVFTKNDHQGRRVRNLVEDAVEEGGSGIADGSDGDVGVKNGTLGTLVHASREEVRVQLDDGRLVAFDPREYQDLRVGYAVTLHKGQGVTIDRSFVLLDPYLDRHGTYVAATRHRDHLELWADEQSFADVDAIGRALSRRGSNDLLARASGPTGGALDELREAIEKEAAVELSKLSGDPDDYVDHADLEGVVHLRGGFVTTQEYLDAENQAAETTDRLAQRYSVRLDVDEAEVGTALARAVDGADLAVFEGERDDARALFREIRDTYAYTDREIIATAFTARAAGELGDELGVESHTFAGLKVRANRLGKKTVLLVDQAHLADTRTMAKILRMADEAGSRVVMVGDPNGFDPLAAGDGFRLVTEGVEAFPLRPEIYDSRILGRLEQVVADGGVEISDANRVVYAYLRAWPEDRPLILAHRRKTAEKLNAKIRDARRHELGESYEIGEKEYAEGDRILFTASDLKGHAVKTVEGEYRPEKGEGVRSGALGTIEEINDSGRFRVRLDEGRVVAFDSNEFSAIDYGYALTTFRANGTRADHVVVLAEQSMDEAAGLVALSSHRQSVRVIAPPESFEEGMKSLEEVFTRRRGKLLARDILDERHHAPRPTYEPARESVPVLERHPILRRRVEQMQTAESGADAPDPVGATKAAIERLRAYDRALVALREIETERAELPHAGATEKIFAQLQGDPAPERRALLDRALKESIDLDSRARTWFADFGGSRDEKVEAVFEASKALGPEGFDKLPAADRALVRDLWEMTIAPIENTAEEYERAERELRDQYPELDDEKARRDYYLSLATQAALALAPRPVRRVVGLAMTIAELYRDTPRTLVRLVAPRPLREVERAIRTVAQLTGSSIEAKRPRPAPVLTRPPREPIQPVPDPFDSLVEALRQGDESAIEPLLDRVTATMHYQAPPLSRDAFEEAGGFDTLFDLAGRVSAEETARSAPRGSQAWRLARARLGRLPSEAQILETLDSHLAEWDFEIERLMTPLRTFDGSERVEEALREIQRLRHVDLPRLFVLHRAAQRAGVPTPFGSLGLDRRKLDRLERLAPAEGRFLGEIRALFDAREQAAWCRQARESDRGGWDL